MQQTQPLEIGIAVSDLDRMLDFYAQVLSCTEERRADIPPSMSEPLAMSTDGYVNVWLSTPRGELIKFMRPPTPPNSTAAPDYLTSQSGMRFFTFYCSDLTETLAKAEALGATLRSDRGHIEEGRRLRLCFVNDPEGNVFELVERAPA